MSCACSPNDSWCGYTVRSMPSACDHAGHEQACEQSCIKLRTSLCHSMACRPDRQSLQRKCEHWVMVPMSMNMAEACSNIHLGSDHSSQLLYTACGIVQRALCWHERPGMEACRVYGVSIHQMHYTAGLAHTGCIPGRFSEGSNRVGDLRIAYFPCACHFGSRLFLILHCLLHASQKAANRSCIAFIGMQVPCTKRWSSMQACKLARYLGTTSLHAGPSAGRVKQLGLLVCWYERAARVQQEKLTRLTSSESSSAASSMKALR